MYGHGMIYHTKVFNVVIVAIVPIGSQFMICHISLGLFFMLVLPIILLLVARLGIDCWTHPSGSRMTTIKTLLESWRKNMK
jgi:hypothetical protein